jgi:hypothetical protein
MEVLMKIKKNGHTRTIRDNDWARFARMGYSKVVDTPKAPQPTKGSTAVEKTPEAPEITRAQLMAQLDQLGIKYDTRANKATLLALVNDHA